MQDTLTPFPTQISGAEFLASRRAALLADAPRVGKTGAAVRAADYVMARTMLVITTATGRAQWGREIDRWGFPRSIHTHYGRNVQPPHADAVVVGWHEFFQQPLFGELASRRWDVLIPDEAHYACNVLNGSRPTQRTVALYGAGGLTSVSDYVWPLTGTPMPNGAPDDLYPMLRGLCVSRLGPYAAHDDYIERFCEVRRRNYQGRWSEMVVGGKNLDDLRERIDGFWLRRTQEDVGIRPPIYSTFVLDIDKVPPQLAADCPEAEAILDAARADDTRSLEMHTGPLRRITGALKAHAVVEAAKEHLTDGRIRKLVLMAWHSDVLDILWDGLAQFGVCGIDGRTPAARRDGEARSFQQDANKRVFAGQIQAAGEVIDLSEADELWFVEYSFLPKDMAQAALRVTNHNRKSQALVRVCALPGSYDEALVGILTPKVATIRKVMEH